jgi:hypothetical protein
VADGTAEPQGVPPQPPSLPNPIPPSRVIDERILAASRLPFVVSSLSVMSILVLFLRIPYLLT